MTSERRSRCYRITPSSLLFFVAAIYTSAAGVSGQEQLSCQQLTDQRCGQALMVVLQQQPQPPLPAVCKAVDMMLGCTSKLLPTCDPLQAAQVAEQVNTGLIAVFGLGSQPNCSLANSTSAVYQSQCNKGLNLCFFELLANAEPPGTDPTQLDTVRGCLFYESFRRCVVAELTSCSPPVMTRVTEEVNSASAKFDADPYTCFTKQGEVKTQECIGIIQNSQQALPPNEVCMLVSEVRGKCLEEAKSLADPSRAGQLEEQFNAYVAFLSQNPFNCQGPSSLPPNNDAGAGSCEAMASACRAPFEQGMVAAGGNPAFVCPEIDKLLECLIPDLDQCTAISRTELVGALRQLIDYHLDPQTFNCSLKNAGHPSLQQDPCDAGIFECSQMMYRARNVPVTDVSTVLEACIHYDSFVGCASDKLGVCDPSRQSVFRPLVDNASRDFNDSPYYCDERKRFDIDSAEGTFATCTDNFQRESLSEKDLDYACSAVAMLEGCLVKVRTMGSPRQISQFTTATETLTAPYRKVPYLCDSRCEGFVQACVQTFDRVLEDPKTNLSTTCRAADEILVCTQSAVQSCSSVKAAYFTESIKVRVLRDFGPNSRLNCALAKVNSPTYQSSCNTALSKCFFGTLQNDVNTTTVGCSYYNGVSQCLAAELRGCPAQVTVDVSSLVADADVQYTQPPYNCPKAVPSTVATTRVTTPAPTTTTLSTTPAPSTRPTTLGSATTTLPPPTTTTLARTTAAPPTTTTATTTTTSSRATTTTATTAVPSQTTTTTPAETTTKARLGPPPFVPRPTTSDSSVSTSSSNTSSTAAALADTTFSTAAASLTTPTPPPSTLTTAPTAASTTVPAPSATPLLTSATSSGTTSTSKPAVATSPTSSDTTSTTTASKPAAATLLPPASPLNATSAATAVSTTSSPPTTSAAVTTLTSKAPTTLPITTPTTMPFTAQTVLTTSSSTTLTTLPSAAPYSSAATAKSPSPSSGPAYEAVLPPATLPPPPPTAATAILTLPPASTTTAAVGASPSRPSATTSPPTAAATSTFPPPTVPPVPATLQAAPPTVTGASTTTTTTTTGTTPEPTRPATVPTVSSADEPGLLATTLTALAAEGAPMKTDIVAIVTGKYGRFALVSAAAPSTSFPIQILVVLFWGIYVPWMLTS